MKPLLLLLLLTPLIQLTYLGNKTSKQVMHEFSVTSQTEGTVLFTLTITGEVLNESGKRTPFQVRKRNVKTPYHLSLENGQYTIEVESKAKQGGMVSKVQRIGSLTSASSDHRKARFEIKPSGDYSATDIL